MAWPVLPHGFLGAQGSETDSYQISRSLRFNSADSAYLSRTPASAGNRRKFTCSAWVKRTGILASSIDVPILSAGDGTNFGISGTGALGGTYDGRFYIRNGGANLCKIPNAIFRDPSAWYHFVFVIDTENATAADRQILYANGVRQENFDGSFAQNTDTNINTTTVHTIGVGLVTTANSGYSGNFLLAEYHFIDGQALTPSSFGETDAITGRWKAKAYTGDYGANGFYLNFSDNSGTTATTLGKDSAPISGTHTAANNWTPNNFSVTAGTGNDSLTDSPANYGTISTTLTDDTYQISRSLRFNSADSAYLSRTPASAGNRKTWTWSGWVKKAKNGAVQQLFNRTDLTNYTYVYFLNDDTIQFLDSQAGSAGSTSYLTTSAVFRDPSAWYHIVLALDTTQATNTNRVKLYVNGVQLTSYNSISWPNQDNQLQINTTNSHSIGSTMGNQQFLDGYLTEINFIDGQALTPDSFGVRDSNYLWKPKAYTGTYGTNGFYLNFSDNSGTTATTLGKDQAGSNNWTPNNFSVASGVGNDSLVDTPTYYGTDAGAGGEARGDYATLNPLQISGATLPTVTNGNLVWTGSNSAATPARIPATIPITSGKWYFEVTRTDNNGLGNYVAAGITNTNASFSTGQYGNNPTSAGGNSNEWALTDRGVACNGSTYTNISSTIGTVGQNDVIRVCVDMDNKKIWFGKNATFSGTPASNTGEAFSNLPASVLPLLYVSLNTTSELAANFGQRPFAYAAPSGFRALRDYNKIPVPTGGVVRGNYATLNPLNAAHTYSNGNLDIVTSTTSYTSIPSAVGSIGMSSGKWYFEFTPTVLGTNFAVGITSIPSTNGYVGQTAASYGYYSLNGNKITGGVDVAYGTSIAVNDVVGVAVDLDSGKIWWSKNGTWQASGAPAAGTNSAYSSIPSGTYFPSVSKDTSGALS